MVNIDKFKPVLYVVIGVVLFFSVNLVGYLSLNQYDIDLTEDNLYTLSDGTRHILEDLEEPITFRFFFSNKTAKGFSNVKSYAGRISGLLEEYVSASGGKVSYQLIDPEPFTDEEDLAVSYGLKGVAIDDQGTKIYLGLAVTNSIDDVRSIPLFAFEREAFLEYDLTRMIYDLSNPKKVKVGLLSSRQMTAPSLMGMPGINTGSAWVVVEQMAGVFDVVPIQEEDAQLPSDIDVLMVVQPKKLSEDLLYDIDQYLLKGGHAVFFVDPNAEGDNGFTSKDASYQSNFAKILRAWGVKVEPDRVVADRQAARRVGSSANKSGYVDYLPWLELKQNNVDGTDVVTTMLSVIHMASAGAVQPLGADGVEVTPLLHSNKQSMLLPTSSIQGAPQPNEVLRQFVSDNTEYMLAARVSGEAKTAFPERSGSNHLKASEKPANIVVVADSDMLRDPFWVKTQNYEGYRIAMPMAENGTFVVNILDHLSGSEDLISLRGRGTVARPFTVVEELKREAEERFLAKEELLKKRLEETEAKIAQLQDQGEQQSGNVLLFKDEQKAAIQRFSQEAVEIRKELRHVQRELRQGIEGLGSVLKFINILLGPIIIVGIALFVLVYRAQRQAAARQASKSKA